MVRQQTLGETKEAVLEYGVKDLAGNERAPAGLAVTVRLDAGDWHWDGLFYCPELDCYLQRDEFRLVELMTSARRKRLEARRAGKRGPKTGYIKEETGGIN